MNKINLQMSLGEIVSVFPGSTAVFNNYKIDYCCGGDRSLKQALEEANIDSNNFIDDLNSLYTVFKSSASSFIDVRDKKPGDLIDYILDKHHVYVKEVLQEIDDLVFKILKVHFKDHSEELLKVHSLFGTLKTELEAHLIKEEENLFPLILDYEKSKDAETLGAIKKFINDTEDEHDLAGDVLKELEVLTRDFKNPQGTCITFKRAYELLGELQKDIFNHVHLENSVLFKMYE